jgi:hypothetical protein
MNVRLQFSCCSNPRITPVNDDVISETSHIETNVCRKCGTVHKLTYDNGRLVAYNSSEGRLPSPNRS